ncbi:hypothetical protein SAMN04488494_0599 [Xylanibacter ruminicola]|uniref:Uncharacterized protein n=1 Tax=Xylanibacter ruminicola TaxID=839 RepID=A0A1M7D215_XYLRU|nr:hypothetical protein SAMN04488494_0599 [Xylanibacter ruminicola]
MADFLKGIFYIGIFIIVIWILLSVDESILILLGLFLGALLLKCMR